jgi:hypothetical protein
MPVGNELKQARERAALSIEQISERTKIQPHKIEALEADDFDSLPTGIYLEGILRAYAHEVALDSVPLIARIRLEHPQPAGVWTAPVVLNGVHGVPTLHAIEDMDVFPSEDIDVVSREDASAPTSPPNEAAPQAREMELARPLMFVLAAAALAAILSQATNLFDSEAPPEAIFSVPTSTTNTAAPAARAEPRAERSSGIAAAPDVSGAWTLATRVESTSYARFAGLQLGYQIELQRDGDRVTGEGRKVTENGRQLRSKAQTPITIDGTVEGDRMTLAFTEQGTRRPTHGTFELQRDNDESLSGRFSSTAARSSGFVSATRR